MTQLMPGTWQHFKGGRYLLLFTALNAETEQDQVVYMSLNIKNPGKVFVRSVASWSEEVLWPDGSRKTRFVFEPPATVEDDVIRNSISDSLAEPGVSRGSVP